MSTQTYPMRRALHLRLEADMDDLELASTLDGVAVDRLRCFELGEVELTPRELSELADQLAQHCAWHGDPSELRELVGPDGSPYDLIGDAVQVLGAVREALSAEYERRLALAAEVPELKSALPAASDGRWAHIAPVWHAMGASDEFEEVTAQVARDAGADVERFLHELTHALHARRHC
jgi:hypothetical protein